MTKGIIPHGQNAVRQSDGGKRTALIKGVISDPLRPLGNRNKSDFQIFAAHQPFVRKYKLFRVAPEFCSAESKGADVAYRRTDFHRSQRRAIIKGAISYGRNAVGDIDFGKRRAIRKSICPDRGSIFSEIYFRERSALVKGVFGDFSQPCPRRKALYRLTFGKGFFPETVQAVGQEDTFKPFAAVKGIRPDRGYPFGQNDALQALAISEGIFGKGRHA